MAEWMNWDSFDRLDRLGLRRFLASEKLLVSAIAVSFLVAVMDAQLGTIFHWVPEFVAFSLLGACLYKIGFRGAFYVIGSISGACIIGFGIFVNGRLYSIPLVMAFLLAYLAGYLRARPSGKSGRRGD